MHRCGGSKPVHTAAQYGMLLTQIQNHSKTEKPTVLRAFQNAEEGDERVIAVKLDTL
jgi:hypothetical protein